MSTPSGQREDAKIEFNRAGHVLFTYQPKETGLHILHVYYNNEKIRSLYNLILSDLQKKEYNGVILLGNMCCLSLDSNRRPMAYLADPLQIELLRLLVEIRFLLDFAMTLFLFFSKCL